MKHDGWCVWSPYQGYLTTTFSYTRSMVIAIFERDIAESWRKYRRQGFEIRPVRFTDARTQEPRPNGQ